MSSGLAVAASAVTFALAYRGAQLGPSAASVLAFAAGAVVNFLGNRFWAWGRRRRAGLARDLLSYALVSGASALAAIGVTNLAEWEGHQLELDANGQAVLVEAAYFATYAAIFLLKFLLLDRVVFGGADQT